MQDPFYLMFRFLLHTTHYHKQKH